MDFLKNNLSVYCKYLVKPDSRYVFSCSPKFFALRIFHIIYVFSFLELSSIKLFLICVQLSLYPISINVIFVIIKKDHTFRNLFNRFQNKHICQQYKERGGEYTRTFQLSGGCSEASSASSSENLNGCCMVTVCNKGGPKTQHLSEKAQRRKKSRAHIENPLCRHGLRPSCSQTQQRDHRHNSDTAYLTVLYHVFAVTLQKCPQLCVIWFIKQGEHYFCISLGEHRFKQATIKKGTLRNSKVTMTRSLGSCQNVKQTLLFTEVM